MSSDIETPMYIKTIEWDMMDKTKFIPLSMASTFSVRACLYPLSLIKTRLQIQKQNELYKGLLDAYYKIYTKEGFAGLYRGFWVSTPQIVSSLVYISSYEAIRHILATKFDMDSRIRALIAGGTSSIISQSIIVPFDVLSQHLMMLGVVNHGSNSVTTYHQLGLTFKPNRTRFQITGDIAGHLYRKDGIKGFYRGYAASLCNYVPNSAIWWYSYHWFQDLVTFILPSVLTKSHLGVQCVAGTLAGCTTAVISNPLDIIRARQQVNRIDSISKTFQIVWREEAMRIFTIGLSTRLLSSSTFSLLIVLGYESIKRKSIKEELKHRVKW